ncbi:MAG: hypothetical protein OXC29_24130 [Rhodococcus sp.]|nr:hypothetical protein [Rhodococcus sp. (in: high G+C Gram-positive bacteria)]
MNPNAKVTLVAEDLSAADVHDVWVLSGDHLSAAAEYPLPTDDDGKLTNAAWMETSQRRSAHLAWKAALRHGLIASDMTFEAFADTRLVDIEMVSDDDKGKGDDKDGLGPFDEASPDESSKSPDSPSGT